MNNRQRKKVIKKYSGSFWKVVLDAGESCSYALIFPQRWQKDKKLNGTYHEMQRNKSDGNYYYKISVPHIINSAKILKLVWDEFPPLSEEYEVIMPEPITIECTMGEL